MERKNLNYYGYDRDTFDSVTDLRRQTNRNNTDTIALLFLILTGVFLILVLLDILPYAHRQMYITYTAIAAAFGVFLILFRKYSLRFAIPLMYASVIILMSYAITSSNRESFQIATLYPVFVVLLSVSYIDRMIPFSIVMSAFCVMFNVFSYLRKPPSILRYDLIYSILFTIVALLFHYRFQRNRISQFLAYHKNLKIQRDLEIRSSFDALSHLLMRGRFFSMADSVLRGRSSDEYTALCVLDLDSFKQINDKLGHQMGDKAIQTAADTIWDTLGINVLDEQWSFCERAISEKLSFAGRLGGDEFIIMLRQSHGWEETETMLRSILDNLNAVELGDLHGIHASFGVTEITENDTDIDVIYSRADEALYEAKNSGKNQIRKH